MASAKHSEIDIESEGKVLNLRWLRNRKIFVTSERSSDNLNLKLLLIERCNGNFCYNCTWYVKVLKYVPALSCFPIPKLTIQ